MFHEARGEESTAWALDAGPSRPYAVFRAQAACPLICCLLACWLLGRQASCTDEARIHSHHWLCPSLSRCLHGMHLAWRVPSQVSHAPTLGPRSAMLHAAACSPAAPQADKDHSGSVSADELADLLASRHQAGQFYKLMKRCPIDGERAGAQGERMRLVCQGADESLRPCWPQGRSYRALALCCAAMRAPARRGAQAG